MDDIKQHQLFHSLQKGSTQAWETYYRNMGPSVLRFLKSIGTHHAEDVLQETFIALYRQAAKLRPDTTVQAWLFRVARNQALKQNSRREMTTLEQAEPVQPQNDKLAALAIQKAVRELKEPFRSTLALFHWEGLTLEEIADVTKTSLNTVKSRLFRARQQLKTQLQTPGQMSKVKSTPSTGTRFTKTITTIVLRLILWCKLIMPAPQGQLVTGELIRLFLPYPLKKRWQS